MIKGLDKGKWSRPTDKSAVYIEIEPGARWGIRVTLFENFAKVEAVQGEKAVWYNAPKRYSTIVAPLIFSRDYGISFEDKIWPKSPTKDASPPKKTVHQRILPTPVTPIDSEFTKLLQDPPC